MTTLFARPKIKIDGADYELIAPDEMSIEANYRLGQLGTKLAKMRSTEGLSEGQQKQLSQVLTQITDIIMAPIPANVRAGLGDMARLTVTEVFIMLLQADKLKLAGATMMKMVSQSAGVKVSPDSSDFTAATPEAG